MKYLIPAVAMVLAAPLYAEQQMGNPSQVFLQTFDADKDGRVSMDEYVKPQVQNIQKQFDYMDKNKDGHVDADEADAYAKEMQERMQQMQQQQGGQYRR
jgi:Ca2+-binding EF-hand superfamily protein